MDDKEYTLKTFNHMPEIMIPTKVLWEGGKTIYKIPWLTSHPVNEEVKKSLHIYEIDILDERNEVEYVIDGENLVCQKILEKSEIEYVTTNGYSEGSVLISRKAKTISLLERNFDDLFESPEDKEEMKPFLEAQKKWRNRNMPTNPAKVFGTVIGAGLAIALITGCFSIIETGERGVVLRFGEYKYTMNEGLNFKAPFIDSVYKLQVRDRSYNSDVEVSSKDMQTIKISSALVYSLDTQKVGDIYRRYGNNIESTIIKPTVAEIINSTIAQYPIEEFVSKRDEISQKIMSTLKTRMSDIGIDIKSFLITNHDFSDDYNKAIEQKKIAEQAAITAEYNKQKAQLDSEANKYRQEGLSKYVLMEKFLDKWDGHMPKVLTSGDSNMSMILDAQDLK